MIYRGLLALCLTACASNRATVYWDNVPKAPTGAEAQSVVHVDTTGPERIIVLWDSVTEVWPCCVEGGVFSATDQPELDELWRRVGWNKRTPKVDFDRYVVFGLLDEGNMCPAKVLGLDAEPGGVLRLRGEYAGACADNLEARAQIVAVPRKFVRRRTVVLFLEFRGAVAFDVPGPRD